MADGLALMRTTHRLLIAWVALAAAATSAQAQEQARLIIAPGTEVRILPRSPGAGTIVDRAQGLSGDTLILSSPPRRIPLPDLASLEVRGGRDRHRGSAIGALAFGAVTAVAGGIDYSHGTITLGDFAGTLLGNVAVGAALGYLLAPTGWVALPLPGR